MPQVVLLVAVLVGLLAAAVEVVALWRVRRQAVPPPPRYPSVSIIKPLCGLDDELELNLRSHLALDYPGEWEVLLGVRDAEDPAYPLARAFADQYPGRVRLVIQEGEPGHNPKVNQLISLTRAARHEVIALTDSNIRVSPGHLREVASTLALPGIGMATHLVGGAGEKALGAVLDNITLAYFGATNLAASAVIMGWDHVVGKSMALRRDLLEAVGGWHEVKDVLAEDDLLRRLVRHRGLRVGVCPTPVRNIQVSQPLKAFFGRQARWLMIRYRLIFPGVLLEPLALPLLISLVLALLSPLAPVGWLIFAGTWACEAGMVQVAARLVRGHGFRLRYLLLLPLREAVFLGAWARAATMRHVDWRGNRLMVLWGTRLAERVALDRVRSIQKLRS